MSRRTTTHTGAHLCAAGLHPLERGEVCAACKRQRQRERREAFNERITAIEIERGCDCCGAAYRLQWFEPSLPLRRVWRSHFRERPWDEAVASMELCQLLCERHRRFAKVFGHLPASANL